MVAFGMGLRQLVRLAGVAQRVQSARGGNRKLANQKTTGNVLLKLCQMMFAAMKDSANRQLL